MAGSACILDSVKDIKDFMRHSKAWGKKKGSDQPKVMSEAVRAKEKV